MTQPQPTPQPTPTPDHTAALNTVIKALVARYGEPQATTPLSIELHIPMPELERASRTTMTIHPDRNDVNPDPFITITVEGM